MVASNEQGGWKVLGQDVQPGHVQVIGDRFLPSDWHAPAGGALEYIRQ